MTHVLLSDTTGIFASRFSEYASGRAMEMAEAGTDATAVPDGVDALVINDLVPALMLCDTPDAAAKAVPEEAALSRVDKLVSAAVEAGVSRIVAISVSRARERAVPQAVIEAADRLEKMLAVVGGDSVVLLRTVEVMDPVAPETLGFVRRLVDGQGAGAGDPIQGIALADLVAATGAAIEVSKLTNRTLDIVTPQAVDRHSFASEAVRLKQLLTDVTVTEVSARPDYPAAMPLLDAAPAALALHVKPAETAWTLLAKTVQEIARQASEAGSIAKLVPPMPAVYRAIETGALPLAGKTVVLSGIGHSVGDQTARLLVQLGAEVVGIARTVDAGTKLKDEIDSKTSAWARVRAHHARLAVQTGRADEEATGDLGTFRCEQADLSDLSAVKALSERLVADVPHMDALVHAGLITLPKRGETEAGIEINFAANLLAPLMLTRFLAKPLQAAGANGGARVVNLVSDGHEDAPVDLDDLQSRWAYAPSHVLAKIGSGQIMVTKALADAMQGTGVCALSVNAGNVHGGVAEDITIDPNSPAATTRQRMEAQQRARRQQAQAAQVLSPAEVAAHLVDTLVSPDFAKANGVYVSDGEVAQPAAHAEDPAAINALWQSCADLTGLKP